MRKILAAKPSITALEMAYVNDAISNGWGEHCYDYLNKFEQQFSSYSNSPFTMATSSCTGALHIAFASMELKAGDEVIVPDITWIASISPIVQLGLTPVFVDIEADTWCIDAEKIAAAITPNTKAILVVHLYGNLADMDSIMAIAKHHDLYVIEDAAEALGSEYKGRKAGSIGDFGTYSFHGTKTMTSGEGGMLISNNEQLFNNAKIIADHGRDPKVDKIFWCEKIGLKYKMSNLQAALGLAQLERIDELITSKRTIFSRYKQLFLNLDLKWNVEEKEDVNSYWMPTFILPESYCLKDRNQIIEQLISKGIQARPFFYPVSIFPMFTSVETNNISYAIYQRGINLPSYMDMTEDDLIHVYTVVKLVLEKYLD